MSNRIGRLILRTTSCVVFKFIVNRDGVVPSHFRSIFQAAAARCTMYHLALVDSPEGEVVFKINLRVKLIIAVFKKNIQREFDIF